MKLQIICRGSSREGLGHLFRTATFARQARAHWDTEIVAIAEPALCPILNEAACPVECVQTDEQVIDPVESFRPNVLVLDTTTLCKDVLGYVRELPELVVSLSPVFEHMQALDLLFTRSTATPDVGGVKVYGGLQYAVFGTHCRVIEDQKYEQALAQVPLPIAVCMGGADAANKTLAVLDALLDVRCDLTVWALLGEGYAHSYDALVNCMRRDRRHEIILAKTNRSTWQIMGHCALAVLAGGLTTVEAVYAGLPSINVFERQEHVDATARELFEQGVCVNGGLFSTNSLNQLVQALHALTADADQLRIMRRRSHGLIDRQGSRRILRRLRIELETRRGSWVHAAERIHGTSHN